MNKMFFFVTFFALTTLSAEVFHYYPSPITKESGQVEWEKISCDPFNEMIVSWNAKYPEQGDYLISLSLHIDGEWTPWMPYAQWGNEKKTTFDHFPQDFPVHVYQDTAEVFDGKKATGFRLRVEPVAGADLFRFYALHANTSDCTQQLPSPELQTYRSVCLDISGLSQVALDHPRHLDLCSPSSTAAVVRFLLKKSPIDPIAFAEGVRDQEFDIYGNWVFNVAEAWRYLGHRWEVYVARLDSFDPIMQALYARTPVVVSVRGPLPGAPFPYKSGHLMVVRGYNAETQEVYVMDPAYPTDDETLVTYPLDGFLEAWNRRGRIAYLFMRKKFPFANDQWKYVDFSTTS